MAIALSTVFPPICHSHAQQRSSKAKAISLSRWMQVSPVLGILGLLLPCEKPQCLQGYFHAFLPNILCHWREEGPVLIKTIFKGLITRTVFFCSKGPKLELSHFDDPPDTQWNSRDSNMALVPSWCGVTSITHSLLSSNWNTATNLERWNLWTKATVLALHL